MEWWKKVASNFPWRYDSFFFSKPNADFPVGKAVRLFFLSEVWLNKLRWEQTFDTNLSGAVGAQGMSKTNAVIIIRVKLRGLPFHPFVRRDLPLPVFPASPLCVSPRRLVRCGGWERAREASGEQQSSPQRTDKTEEGAVASGSICHFYGRRKCYVPTDSLQSRLWERKKHFEWWRWHYADQSLFVSRGK